MSQTITPTAITYPHQGIATDFDKQLAQDKCETLALEALTRGFTDISFIATYREIRHPKTNILLHSFYRIDRVQG